MTSRRNFLRSCLAGGVAAASAVLPETACARDVPATPAEGPLACSTTPPCASAARSAWRHASRPTRTRAISPAMDKLWIRRRHQRATPFNLIKMYRNGTMKRRTRELNGFSFMKTSYAPRRPVLRLGRPVSAMTKTGHRRRRLRPDACIGCRYCVAACPFGIPKYQ